MKSKSPSHIFSLVGLLILILAGQAGTQGFFWCLGEGRSALEYAAGQECNPVPQQADHQNHHENTFGLPSQGEDCGPCFDVASTVDAASVRIHGRSDFSGKAESPASAQISPLPEVALTLSVNQPPKHSLSIDQTILFHRTVVLLT